MPAIFPVAHATFLNTRQDAVMGDLLVLLDFAVPINLLGVVLVTRRAPSWGRRILAAFCGLGGGVIVAYVVVVLLTFVGPPGLSTVPGMLIQAWCGSGPRG